MMVTEIGLVAGVFADVVNSNVTYFVSVTSKLHSNSIKLLGFGTNNTLSILGVAVLLKTLLFLHSSL